MAKKAESSTNMHALLIAVDCYLPNILPDGSYPSLAGCVRDVKHVEGFLRGTLKVPAGNILKLTSTYTGDDEPPEAPGDRPTYENIINAFKTLARNSAKGDQVYIHYSGHGGRSTTAYPAIKGKGAQDESLVPLDIGDSEARYVRDLEVAALLKTLTDKGLHVTVVFDCCHSGGATRAISNNVGVRGAGFVDTTRRPPGDVVIPDDVKAKFQENQATRGLTAASGFLLEPEGYTLLAACRPNELAYESVFDGHEKNGALTYWMLDTLASLGPKTTYKDVYDRILAKVHSQFELQTPMLEGDAERVVFGVTSTPSRPTAIVLKVDDAANTVTVGGGQATGLRKGAQLAVYARGEGDLADAKRRKGVVQIEGLGATESTATILPARPRTRIEDGDQAVPIGAGSAKLVRGVRLMRADGKPMGKGDASLQAVAKALPNNGWVEPAAPGAQADFVVSLNDDGTEYEICDGGGVPIANLRPALRVGDRDAAETVVKRLVHLAKYRAVQELDNFDQSSPLRGKLTAEIVGTQKDYDPVDRPDPKPLASPLRPRLQVGETAFLKITNQTNLVLNVTVLDLESTWRISQIFPGGQNVFFEPVDPGQSLPLIPLNAGLPDEYDKGTDVIKVFATTGASNFQVLILPQLDQPSEGRGATRSATRGPADPLASLLDAVAAEEPKVRSLTPQSNPSTEWVVAQLEVVISREAPKDAPPAGTGTRKNAKKAARKAARTTAKKAVKKAAPKRPR